MREYKVAVLDEAYTIEADDYYHARADGARRYLSTHPELTFTSLMRYVSARLANPELAGRKAKNNESF